MCAFYKYAAVETWDFSTIWEREKDTYICVCTRELSVTWRENWGRKYHDEIDIFMKRGKTRVANVLRALNECLYVRNTWPNVCTWTENKKTHGKKVERKREIKKQRNKCAPCEPSFHPPVSAKTYLPPEYNTIFGLVPTGPHHSFKPKPAHTNDNISKLITR